MDKLPFTVYDFFAYLSSGFVVLVAAVAAFLGYGPIAHTPSLVVGLVLIVAAYCIGHVIANLAGYLIERRIVRGFMRMPTAILMDSWKAPAVARLLFPGYTAALPQTTRARIGSRADAAGVTDRGEGLFYHCHAAMKDDATVQGRLNTFLNLYGFARNMSLALVLSAIMLGVGIVRGSAQTGPEVSPGWWIGAGVVVAIGLFYRYLKFLRQYGVELLTSYAEGHDS